MKVTSTMYLIPSLTLFLGLVHQSLSEGSVDIVYPNHRYFDILTPAPQTPHTFQRSGMNHLTQKVPTHQTRQRIIQFTRLKNMSSPQPLKLAMVKRSGDYHYMDYPQYDMDDHGLPYNGGHRLSALRTIPYQRYPIYDKPQSRFDISSIGVIAILKLILIKILSFGVFKLFILFLLKFPLILFTLGFKLIIILKLIKLVKLLTLPIIIPFILILIAPILIIAFFLLLPLLLPLILAPIIPLILIPILLPLLLSIPVPVLAPTTGRRRRRHTDDAQSRSVQEDVLYLVRRVLESEQCIERVACQFAANKQSQGYTVFVAWYLDKVAGYIKNPRFSSYKDAYKKGMSSSMNPQYCPRVYACNNPRNAL